MSSKFRKGLILVAIMLVLCLMSSVVSAATIDQALPTAGIAPEGLETPIGTIAKSVPTKPSAQPDNVIFTDYFDSVYNSYDGYYDRGEVYRAGPNSTSAPDAASYTYAKTVANDYNASFNIADDVVSAGVGFSVTYTESKSWTYTFTIPPGQTIGLHYRDWYHVKQFNCHRHYWLDGSNLSGTGSAEQWYMPQFYTVRI